MANGSARTYNDYQRTPLEGTRSPEFFDGGDRRAQHLTWLQRQQKKLRERREYALRSQRQPHEARLLSELRALHGASHRPDGYTSDTTMFADEDEEDFSVPLHINTSGAKLNGGSSAPGSPLLNRSPRRQQPHYGLNRQKSDCSFDREKPFAAVKRFHEENARRYAETSPPQTPRSTAPSPLDHRVLTTNNQYNNLLYLQNNGVDEPDFAATLIEDDRRRASVRQKEALQAQAKHAAMAYSSYHPQRLDPSSYNGNVNGREDSYSSWRSDDSGTPRPNTPAFPVYPRTPYANNSVHHFDTTGLPPKSPTTQRKDRSPSPSDHVLSHSGSATSVVQQHSPKSIPQNGGQLSPTVYSNASRRSSTPSEPPQYVLPQHVKFVRDTSRFWYKPNISREEAIALVRDAPPGTFVVRDSNSFPGAFGLALKVAVPPATVAQKAAYFSGDANELVRHFLIEPTSRGVRLKGCTNEPVFSSLSALVYQHSLMPMALPCKLLLPEGEPMAMMKQISDVSGANPQFTQGAACNVLYLLTLDTESLTGPQAVRRAVQHLYMMRPLPVATVVHFKVSSQGITLTDNKRRLFFRRHYPTTTLSHCGLDPDDHRWTQKDPNTGVPISSNRVFGFVARKPASKADNQCHIFADLEPEQPANAIVNFVCKVMANSGSLKSNIV